MLAACHFALEMLLLLINTVNQHDSYYFHHQFFNCVAIASNVIFIFMRLLLHLPFVLMPPYVSISAYYLLQKLQNDYNYKCSRDIEICFACLQSVFFASLGWPNH